MVRGCLIRSLALAVAAAPSAAFAASPAPAARAALLPLAFTGDVSDGVRLTVEEGLASGLAATGLELGARDRVASAIAGEPGRCADASCWRKLWVRVGCRYVVGGELRGDDRSYELRLWLGDARRGETLARVARRCDLCGQREVGLKVGLAASALRAKLEGAMALPARVAVEAQPAGAEILLDGRTIGRAPRELELAPGEHELVIRRPGYLAAVRRVRALAGVQERLRVRLLAEPPRRSPLRAAGWAGIGVGAAALGAGIALVALDGRGAGCEAQQVPGGQCREVWRTGAGGWTLTSSGIAAVLAGAYLVYRGVRDAGRTAPHAAGREHARAAGW